MRPRRGLPADDDFDATDEFEDTNELEVSAVRRRLLADDELDQQDQGPQANSEAPSRASRRAADPPDDSDEADEPTGPGRRASRASVEEPPADLPEDAAPPAPMSVIDEPDPVDTDPTIPVVTPLDAGTTTPADFPAAAPIGSAPTRPAKAKSAKVTPSKAKEASATPNSRLGRHRALSAVAVIVGTLLATLGVGALPAEQAPVPDTVPLVTALSRICPAADAQPGTLYATSSDGQIRLREIGDDDHDLADSPLVRPDQTRAVVVGPDLPRASVVGGNLISTENQLWWGACRSALADQYVQLPGGSGAQLLIINPDRDPALIDITLSGPDGEITGDGLRGITIPANSQQIIDLAAHAADVAALGARVRSSIGRVQAVGLLSNDDGAGFASSTLQGTLIVVAAAPADPAFTRLVLTNPGTGRNIISIQAFGEAGSYDLPGFESYALNAQSTVVVDLSDAIGGLPVGLSISGRDVFAATLVTSKHGDLAIEPGQLDEQNVAAQDLVSVVPGPGVLHVTNPSEVEALVVVDWGAGQAPANRTIAPGASTTVEIPAGASWARVNSTAPIAAALLIHQVDRSGFAIVRLQPAARSQASMPMELDIGMGR